VKLEAEELFRTRIWSGCHQAACHSSYPRWGSSCDKYSSQSKCPVWGCAVWNKVK